MGVSIRPEPPQSSSEEQWREKWRSLVQGGMAPDSATAQIDAEYAASKRASPAQPPRRSQPTTGVSDDQLNAVIEEIRASYGGSTKARLAGAAKAIPWQDEIVGAAGTMVGVPYEVGRRKTQEVLAGAIKGHEREAMIGELAAGALIPLGAASRAVTLGGRVASGAKAGGVMGAAIGSGEAEGGAVERVKGGARGAGVGTVLGALFPLLAAAGKGVVTMAGRPRATPSSESPRLLPSLSDTDKATVAAKPFRTEGIEYRHAGPAVTGIETREDVAADKFLQGLTRSGQTPDDLARAAAERAARGKPATPLELGGENMRGLGEAVASVPGRGKQILSDALEARRGQPFRTEEGGAYPRISHDLEQGMGLTAGSTSEATESIIANQRAKARVNYERAKFNPDGTPRTVSDPLLTEALTVPHFQRAYERGRDIAALERRTLPTIDQVREGADVPVEAIDYMKKGVDAVIERGGESGAALDRTTAKALRDRLNEVLERVDELVPEYGHARAVFKGDAEAREALEYADEAMTKKNVRGADIKARLATMTPGEKEMARQGAINVMQFEAGQVADGGNIAAYLAKNPNKRGRLEAFFDDPAEFDTFLSNMADEDAFVTTDRRVLGGSPTARRLAAQEDMGDLPTGATLQEVAKGGLLTALPRRIWDAARRRYVEGTAEELAPMLVAGATPESMPFPELLERLAQANARVRQSATRATAVGRVSGQQAGSQFGDRSKKRKE